MNVRTFYKIYYEHRIKKSSIILKLYILIFFPNKLFFEQNFFLQSKKNLDLLAKKNQSLFDKDFKFLFEHFNSDKGEKYINQYQKSLKFEKKSISGHKYYEYYESYFFDKKK